METMQDYTIYCTPKQVKKAIGLGAPIEIDNGDNHNVPIMLYNRKGYVIPTTEEMFRWLEKQKEIEFTTISKAWGKWYFYINIFDDTLIENGFQSREQAILKAIDTALEYLIRNEK